MAQKEVYEPVAAFAREYDTRFYSGETIERSFDVFNDSVTERRLRLRCSLEGVGQREASPIELDPAGYDVVKIEYPLPKVTKRRFRWLRFA